MESTRFDGVVKALAGTLPRRQLLRALATATGLGLLAPFRQPDGTALAAGPPCARLNESCATRACCGALACTLIDQVCTRPLPRRRVG
jgi:hypothetical protein